MFIKIQRIFKQSKKDFFLLTLPLPPTGYLTIKASCFDDIKVYDFE